MQKYGLFCNLRRRRTKLKWPNIILNRRSNYYENFQQTKSATFTLTTCWMPAGKRNLSYGSPQLLRRNLSGNWVVLRFQWTKILYPNILSHIVFFFTLFKSYTYNLVICNNTKDNFLCEPAEKIYFKFHRDWENTGKIVMRRISLFNFVKFEAFEVCFLGLP